MLAGPLAELLQAQIGVLDVPAHAEVGAVDLQDEAGLGHGLVLLAHGLGDGKKVGLVVLVVLVAEEQRDHAGRGRAHEALRRRGASDRSLQVFHVAQGFGRAAVAHGDRAVAGRRLAARAARVTEHALGELRELGEVLVDEGVAGAAEAVEAVFDVRGVAWLRHLAVVDEVDAGRHLPAHHLGHCRAYPGRQRAALDGHALLLGVHHAHQVLRPRQAAGMRGEKPLGAALHGPSLDAIVALADSSGDSSPTLHLFCHAGACPRHPAHSKLGAT